MVNDIEFRAVCVAFYEQYPDLANRPEINQLIVELKMAVIKDVRRGIVDRMDLEDKVATRDWVAAVERNKK